MNIREAKQQIKNAVRAYLTKDEFGNYKIPVERQRPVFLMGAPGIGKTAIMAQIAQELNIGLVSYSMTHHTRQSALGLPFIVEKTYDGQNVSISKYTMSEIIANVYETMEKSGVREGILFLDEINCVSETLAPAMLQFLQYKIFGTYTVPEGWIVVTAGNPPEYNRSVREFDIVTWDRLKRIDVEPDYDAWHAFAVEQGEHPAIISYLAIKKTDFYSIETTVDGKSFVTARGWDDLSQMIKLYEENGMSVDERLIGQYLQNKRIAKDFAIYYDLFNKYRADYKIDAILSGQADEDVLKRAAAARFDERLSLVSMLTDALTSRAREVTIEETSLKLCTDSFKELQLEMTRPNILPGDALSAHITRLRETIASKKAGSTLSHTEEAAINGVIKTFEAAVGKTEVQDILTAVKKSFDARARALKKRTAQIKENMNNAFIFAAAAFGEGQELLILLTELTVNADTSSFIKQFGCEQYFKYNKSLMFYERGKALSSELDGIDLESL